jgi:predicted enzyme related to lactoylglutathione lyase
MANRITSLCVDCTDAHLLAAFWTQVLGWQITGDDEEGVRIQASPDATFAIDFLVVPDGPKVVKNRLHLDVNPTDCDQVEELHRLLALGARPVEVGQSSDSVPVTWHVLADPEGNEFCLLRSRVRSATLGG